MSYVDIASVWEQWLGKGELKGTFLLSIGVDICRQKDPANEKPLLKEIKDKVVQDVDESEGTGVWTSEEGMRLHVPIPTIAAAHQFRIASADADKRKAVKEAAGDLPWGKHLTENSKNSLVQEDLRMATYGCFLASFIQGLGLLAKANTENKWSIDFTKVIDIWRAGCIIQADSIADLLEAAYQNSDAGMLRNPLGIKNLAREMKKTFPFIKKVVLFGVEADAYIPALSATLEYIKYSFTEEDLPTQFMESELDYFGAHDFDLKGGSGEPKTGKCCEHTLICQVANFHQGRYHFGWNPAKDVPESKTVSEA